MNVLCNKKRKVRQMISLELMTCCYEGSTPEFLDALYDRAKNEGQLDQIWEARDVDGNRPFQKAAKHGNPKALSWVIQKWKNDARVIEMNLLDCEGNTSLIACCLRAYNTGS
jgi:hypothetical protein